MLEGSETGKAFGSLIGAYLLSTINNHDGAEVKEKRVKTGMCIIIKLFCF